MLFSDPIFFLFFSSYFFIHQILPRHFMMVLVILGSTFFYGYWNPLFIPLPFALVTFTYLATFKLNQIKNKKSKKQLLTLFLIFLFLPLLGFKYLKFFLDNMAWLFSSHTMSQGITNSLPLGISFITFTLAAYLIDVSRGKFPIEKNFLSLLSSVLFFPHLIAGPIVRPSQLIPQLKRWDPKLSAKIPFGVLLFSIGMFKKLVLADSVASLVNQTYSQMATASAWSHLIAFYGFTVQIYCDFSGYTDMALGLSHVLGIRLPNNFSRPYIATSITEFWTRWHITLSNWLKDYLYIPLGGNRNGFLAQMKNIVITMVLGGLWHGANWTFVLWGLFHAFGIVCNHAVNRFIPNLKLPRWAAWFLTFHFVSLGWVFFRAPTISVATNLLKGFVTKNWNLNLFSPEYFYGVAIFFCFVLTHKIDRQSLFRLWTIKLPSTAIYTLAIMLIGISLILSSGNSADFIYFDF